MERSKVFQRKDVGFMPADCYAGVKLLRGCAESALIRLKSCTAAFFFFPKMPFRPRTQGLSLGLLRRRRRCKDAPSTKAPPSLSKLYRPVNLTGANAPWGIDVVAETLRQLETHIIALNPGPVTARGPARFYRELSRQRNAADDLRCLHEEVAVSDRSRLPKSTGNRDGIAAVTLNGRASLFHATMAIFNHAWVVDLAGSNILGGHSPVDAAQRTTLDRLISYRKRPGRHQSAINTKLGRITGNRRRAGPASHCCAHQ